MSIIKIFPEDQESFSIVTNPVRTFNSSSNGITGSVNIFARRSKIEKNIFKSLAGKYNDSNISSEYDALYIKAIKSVSLPAGNFQVQLQKFLDSVNKQKTSDSKNKKLNITRFTPPTQFSSGTMKKLYVKDILMPQYRSAYQTANWAYTNYNSINFFTSSTVPTSSVLLYPAPPNEPGYELIDKFSFDFYINPRYKQDSNKDFKAGTILHYSSSYAISLITGSARDENGRSTGFRLQLQLSHSAEIPPSLAKPGSWPHNLVFLSDDNSLSWNKWHHVVIRWGNGNVNNGTGSFNIDGIDKGYFVLPSASFPELRLLKYTTIYGFLPSQQPAQMLSVGNFYEGSNAGSSKQQFFFAADTSKRDGILKQDNTTSINEPAKYAFNHPLNAEIHDLAIKNYYMTDLDIRVSASVNPSSVDPDPKVWAGKSRILFYLPPYFTQTSSLRQAVGSPSFGGVPQTLKISADSTTTTPYNVALAYSIGGHYINIENYTKDFVTNNFPRLHHMTRSIYKESNDANEMLYTDPFVIRRNLFIMPCDDGLFTPNYTLLAREIKKQNSSDDTGNQNLSLINLSNMISAKSLIFGTTFSDVQGKNAPGAEQFIEELLGPTPENPNASPGTAYTNFMNAVKKQIQQGNYDPGISTLAPLTIFHRTLDPSSDQITFFDISNLYYGKRIMPGSFIISDSNITGSGGTMGITLKDDGRGGLYRADSLTAHATWNNVGNIFYEEGVVIIKNPHLYFFGKNQYDISFKGEQNIHTLKFGVVAPRNQINSSSNPCYQQLPPTGYLTDTDPNYVYITGLNFHDKDMNVVAKTQLAQPIVKRYGDRIMFKVTMDFL